MTEIKIVFYSPTTKLIVGLLTPEESLNPGSHIPDYSMSEQPSTTSIPVKAIPMFGIAVGQLIDKVFLAYEFWDFEKDDATQAWKDKVASGDI